MPSSKYKCIKCGSGVSGGSHPLVGTCSKGGGHQWVVEDGARKNYKCIKCGRGVAGNSHPLVGGCSKGGEHEWVS
jgi:DNA-directed RNA polymerase subunit RPC12/RpoP